MSDHTTLTQPGNVLPQADRAPAVGSWTPWGKADHVTVIAEGLVSVSTPSHGGYWLSQWRHTQMPPALGAVPTFAGGRWYEEDCDWALVCVAFPECFPADALAQAEGSLARWQPEVWARYLAERDAPAEREDAR